jgi:hypothetical protein
MTNPGQSAINDQMAVAIADNMLQNERSSFQRGITNQPPIYDEVVDRYNLACDTRSGYFPACPHLTGAPQPVHWVLDTDGVMCSACWDDIQIRLMPLANNSPCQFCGRWNDLKLIHCPSSNDPMTLHAIVCNVCYLG